MKKALLVLGICYLSIVAIAASTNPFDATPQSTLEFNVDVQVEDKRVEI